MNVQFYRDSINQHGVGATLYHAVYRAANQVTEMAVWNALVLTVDTLDKKLLADPRRANGRMISAADMRPYVDDRANVLTTRFIDEAVTNGDRCYALFEGDELAAYAWYATRQTRLLEITGAPVLHFDTSYVYLYHGFTKPKFRGQRLHAVGMASALVELAGEGKAGLVSYVDSSNLASLKSCYRMGWETFGRVAMVKLGGHYHFHCTPGCKQYDFRVESAAS